MVMSRTVARFVVRGADGRRSSEWRIWPGQQGGRPTDDVYMAPRHKISDYKISLHKDGWAQVGLSQAVRQAARVGDRHALARWQIASDEIVDGWRPAFRLNFPECHLILGPAIDSRCISIGEPRPGMAISVLVLFGDSGAELPRWLEPFRIAVLDRRSGGHVALLAVELPFGDELSTVAAPKFSWDMPGTQAPPSPYGWAQSTMPDGTHVWTEFSQVAGPIGPIDLPGFKGEVLPWEHLPEALSGGDLACALLMCARNDSARLYIDARSRCNHSHLAYDVGVLVEAYRTDALDEGWNLFPDGSACTALMPRRRAVEAQLEVGTWAPSPRPLHI